jgi:DNA modification methylase
MDDENLVIKYVPIGSVHTWEKNPKKHNVKGIIASMKRLGVYKPIIVQKSTQMVVAGHGRLEALKALKKEMVPIIERELTDAEAHALALVDNETTISGGWDDGLLAIDLQDLKVTMPDLDMGVFGFSEKQEGRKAVEDDFDPDEALGQIKEPTTKLGDVIILGSSRLMCGDCTSEAAVKTLFDNVAPDLLLTDPPYCSGGFQEAGKGSGSIGTRSGVKIANDTLSTRGFQSLIQRALNVSQCPAVYLFTDWRMWINLFDVVESQGLGVRSMIVWDKGSMGMGQGWRMQHELVMFAHRLSNPYNPKSSRGNVIQASRTGNKNHPTEKPISLIVELLKVSEFATNVYDAFGGSGSTLIACEQLGRKCFTMELDPTYCDVIVKRWEAMTGLKAVRTSQ